MDETVWWARESFWRKTAIWVTAGMAVLLIILTFDSISKITAGSKRVPGYDVINKRIYYRFDDNLNHQVPVIGDDAPLFGKKLSAKAATALVTKGKMIIQGRNCMNCHTLLGNGAYYAPDLTKAWLDPAWDSEQERETAMLEFLQNPQDNQHNERGMPNLKITKAEAKAIIAFLKWMSSINTNGFPYNFKPIAQKGDE